MRGRPAHAVSVSRFDPVITQASDWRGGGGAPPRPRKLGFATRALPTAKTRPGSGVGSPTLAGPPGRPASVLVALALAFLRSRLDPRHAGGRGEEGRVTVVPTDSQARRLFLEHLFDHAPAPGLADPLRLDHDHVSRVRPHAQPHLLPQLEAGL